MDRTVTPFGPDATEKWNLTFSAGAVAATWALISPGFAASVAIGALLEAINFRALRAASIQLFAGTIQGSRTWVGVFALRFVFVGAAILFVLAAGAHPLGVTVGLLMIVPALFVAAWRARPEPIVGLEGPPPDDPSWDEWNAWFARENVPIDEDEEQ